RTPKNRGKRRDSPADLRNLAHDVIRGDFGQVRAAGNAPTARRTVLMLVADAPETPVHTEKVHLVLILRWAQTPRRLTQTATRLRTLAARRGPPAAAGAAVVRCKVAAERQRRHSADGGRRGLEAGNAPSTCCTCSGSEGSMSARSTETRRGRGCSDWRIARVERASDLARLSGHSELASYIEREMRLVVNAHGEISGLTAQEERDRLELQRLAKSGDSAGLRASGDPRRIATCLTVLGVTALMLAAGTDR
uniref:Syntaxin-6_N domain-containing protein n=1 Tax=Macrostomum lignano TaxID=282301 RepID=A0A1I8FJQ5_9PLAT